MIDFLLRSATARLRRSKSLYALTVLGVALGVAAVLGIQIINRSAIAAFAGTLRAVSGDADLSVVGRLPTFPDSTLVRVLAVPGVAHARPLYQLDVAVSDPDSFFLQVLGVDLTAPIRLPRVDQPRDIGAPITQRGWVAVSPTLAREKGWTTGDTVGVSIGSRRATLVVGALIDFRQFSAFASRKLAVMDLAQVQGLLGRPGVLNQIDIRARSGVSTVELANRLSRTLGAAYVVSTPQQRQQQGSQLLDAFRLNLTALSAISLVVGLFVVYSSTLASLVRRRSEFGLLRSLGATRGQVFGLIVVEVAALGLVGVAIGLPAGYWVAALNMDVVSETLTNVYLLQEIEAVHVPPDLFGLAAVVGPGGAVLGAALPAWDMSRRDTHALLAPFTLHERMGTAAGRLFGWGALLLLGGGIWYIVWGREWRPAGFVLAIVLILTLPLFTPLVIRTSARHARSRRLGVGLALQSLASGLQTTSFAVASLAVAVCMLVGLTFMIDSFRRTVDVWVRASIRADIYITTPSWAPGATDAVLDSAVLRGLADHPEVIATDRLRQLPVFTGAHRIWLNGVATDRQLNDRFRLYAGDPVEADRRFRAGIGALISEPLSRKAGLVVGDTLRIAGLQGPVEIYVAAVYYDYGNEAGAAIVALDWMTQSFGPGAVTNAALYLRGDADIDQVIDDLERRFASVPLRIRSNRTLRGEVLTVFDQTFAVTRVLRAIGLLIAVAGVTLSLLVLAHERIAELALFRALGATARQLFGYFVSKGLALGLMGFVFGSVAGVGLALILIYLINRAYFGWTIQVYWPWRAWVELAGWVLGAAVVASAYPALRASQTPATELRRDDV